MQAINVHTNAYLSIGLGPTNQLTGGSASSLQSFSTSSSQTNDCAQAHTSTTLHITLWRLLDYYLQVRLGMLVLIITKTQKRGVVRKCQNSTDNSRLFLRTVSIMEASAGDKVPKPRKLSPLISPNSTRQRSH
jgi:hypothetical protein